MSTCHIGSVINVMAGCITRKEGHVNGGRPQHLMSRFALTGPDKQLGTSNERDVADSRLGYLSVSRCR
jgi:hypothetical protein